MIFLEGSSLIPGNIECLIAVGVGCLSSFISNEDINRYAKFSTFERACNRLPK